MGISSIIKNLDYIRYLFGPRTYKRATFLFVFIRCVLHIYIGCAKQPSLNCKPATTQGRTVSPTLVSCHLSRVMSLFTDQCALLPVPANTDFLMPNFESTAPTLFLLGTPFCELFKTVIMASEWW